MKRVVIGLVGLVLAAIVLAGCQTFTPQDAMAPMSAVAGKDFIITFQADKVPGNIAQALAAAGGELKKTLAEIGAVVATAKSDDFALKAAALKGVTGVIPDVQVNFLSDETRTVEFTEETITGSDEPYFGRQWGLRAINAPGAWDAGYTGSGVRVAVLDTGIDVNHRDLAPNLNVALSKSFNPDEPTIDDFNGHGSNVAGIIAAADNAWGVIGVAPEAEIVALKVLSGSGSGDFSWLLEAILYAVSIDADVVNMSLGAYLPHRGFLADDGTWVGANEVAGFVNLVKKVSNYAIQQGVLLVSTAGNSAIDMTGDQGLLHVPADAGGTLMISATGPLGVWQNPNTNLDVPATYTNYGANVNFAAPGGNYDPTLPNYWFDFVLNCYWNGGFVWMAGTSQAAPHVSGVAALIIERYNHSLSPSQIEGVLRQSADDLGKPGRDSFYGQGRVNAAQAVR